ncbi:MAG TPA: PQQ-binding-like beta-propeller repeat protein [Euzebyales bacterium]
MDRDELRARLQRAAAALPDGPDDARGGVGRRVRRHRQTASLTILAAVLALALAGTVLVLPGSQDGAVEFADSVQPSSAPSDAAAVTDPAVTDDTETATAQGVAMPCRPVDAPPQDGAQLARVYVPCGSSQVGSAPTVAVQYRWVDDRSPTALVGAVFDCPDDAERRAGRVCLLDDPGQKPVSDVTVSGDVAQVTLTDAIRELAETGGTEQMFDALRATIFANLPDVDRIDYALADAGAGGICELVGAADGCEVATRDDWASRPDGWRQASAAEPLQVGTFGGTRPTGPVQVDDVVVETDGWNGSEVRALDAGTGEERWTHTLEGPTNDAYVAGQHPDGLVLVAPSIGDVTALDASTGEVMWMWYEKPKDIAPGPPAVADGVVYFLGSFTNEGNDRAPVVTAVDGQSGRILWETELQSGTELQWSPPTVAGDLVLVSDTTGTEGGEAHLTALRRDDGEFAWTVPYARGQQGFHSVQPLVTDGVAVAANGTLLYGIDVAQGRQLWRRQAGSVAMLFGVTDGGVLADAGRGLEVIDAVTGRGRRP